MLLQLITTHPESIGPIVRQTPPWVWGLFAALLALGLSQLRARTAGRRRVIVLPAAMGLFSVLGTWTALGRSPHAAAAALTWMAAAAGAFAFMASRPSAGRFDPVRRRYHLPGSAVPLLLILGIFLLKYGVGVELALAPQQVNDAGFALTVAGLYGALTGLFTGRAWGLVRLGKPAAPAAGAA